MTKLKEAQEVIKRYNLKGKQKEELLKLAKILDKKPTKIIKKEIKKDITKKPVKFIKRNIVRKLESKQDFLDAINELKKIMGEVESSMPPKKGLKILKTQIKEAGELHLKLAKITSRYQTKSGYKEIEKEREKDLLLNIISGSFSGSYHHLVGSVKKKAKDFKDVTMDKEGLESFLEVVIASAIMAYKEINNIK